MLEVNLPRRLAFVVAHPDDETEIAAGLIHENYKLGGFNALFCATKGEKGRANLPFSVTEEELGRLREKELFIVSKYLGVEHLIVGNFKDGALDKDDTFILNSVRSFLEYTKPDLIVSFGECGYSGHKDHVAIHKIVKKVSVEMGLPMMEFATPDKDIFPDFHLHLNKKRKHGVYEADLKMKKPNIQIKIQKDVKIQAMKMHETQYAGLNPYNNFPEGIAEHILSYEYFYLE